MLVAAPTVKVACVVVMVKDEVDVLTTLGTETVMVVPPAEVTTAGYEGELISVPGIS